MAKKKDSNPAPEKPVATAEIPVMHDMGPDFTSGRLHMTIQGADIKDEKGNEVGAIHNVVPVGIQVVIGKDYYTLGARQIWNAVCVAVGKPDLVMAAPKKKRGRKK